MTAPSEPREFRYADLVGRWRLRLTPAFRDFVVESVAHDAPPPSKPTMQFERVLTER